MEIIRVVKSRKAVGSKAVDILGVCKVAGNPLGVGGESGRGGSGETREKALAFVGRI